MSNRTAVTLNNVMADLVKGRRWRKGANLVGRTGLQDERGFKFTSYDTMHDQAGCPGG